MPIPLALIASSSSSSHEILISSTDPGAERFQTAAATILTRIDSRLNSRLSYAFEDWLFHYVSEEGFIFMCVADGEGGRRLPFALLSEVQKQLLSQFDEDTLESATPTTLFPFHQTLDSLRLRFSQSPQSDPVKTAQAELGAVKDIMTQNIEEILHRGERIELLMDRTGEAANQSLAFRRRAKGLRRQMWWKNVKVMALAGFCGVVFLIFLYSLFS